MKPSFYEPLLYEPFVALPLLRNKKCGATYNVNYYYIETAIRDRSKSAGLFTVTRPYRCVLFISEILRSGSVRF